MRERPILFSGPMVRAILDGRKTMTRRVVKAPLWFGGFPPARLENGVIQRWGASKSEDDIPCPYGQPGDRLWVRETWTSSVSVSRDGWKRRVSYFYRADEGVKFGRLDNMRWHASIHMPRRASRLTLEVEAVRVERLQNISELDVEREGFMPEFNTLAIWKFQHIWNSLNAKRGYGWSTNPWVWVITFRRLA